MSRRTRKILGTLVGALFASQALMAPARACTSVLIRSADGGFIYGRTMEFGLPLQSAPMVMPRNLAIAGTGPSGAAGTGLAWTTKYGVVGLNALGLNLYVDGMNEKGLAAGGLYLPNLAEFQDVQPADAKTSIASYELVTYLLTSFATVAEVKEGLPKIKVNRAPQATFKAPVPLHFAIHDATGASLVVEYVGGALKIHDNPTSILTNAPTFDWHLANLGQYVNLSPIEPKPLESGGLAIASPSTGAGLHGLPGDMLSPSRFVRAFFFARNAPTPATSQQAVGITFHIMNNFDIPPGAVVTQAGAAAGGGVAGYEITEWTVAADLKTLRYYFATYDNPTRRVLDATKVDFSGKAPSVFPIDQKESVVQIGG